MKHLVQGPLAHAKPLTEAARRITGAINLMTNHAASSDKIKSDAQRYLWQAMLYQLNPKERNELAGANVPSVSNDLSRLRHSHPNGLMASITISKDGRMHTQKHTLQTTCLCRASRRRKGHQGPKYFHGSKIYYHEITRADLIKHISQSCSYSVAKG